MVPRDNLPAHAVLPLLGHLHHLRCIHGVSEQDTLTFSYSAIEVITSQRRTFHRRDENNNIIKYSVNVWNPTVANLSLMALGSSAPEILLNVLEALKGLIN